MPPGRPSKLTPELQEAICKHLRAGNYRGPSAQAAGIGERTIVRWCRLGKQRGSGPYYEFWRAIVASEKSAETRLVAIITGAAEGEPNHAKWWLERKFPDRWGREKERVRKLEQAVEEIQRLLTSAVAAKAGQADIEVAPAGQ